MYKLLAILNISFVICYIGGKSGVYRMDPAAKGPRFGFLRTCRSVTAPTGGVVSCVCVHVCVCVCSVGYFDNLPSFDPSSSPLEATSIRLWYAISDVVLSRVSNNRQDLGPSKF